MSVKPIPDGYHSVTPYLMIKGASAAIDFYRKAFNATEVYRLNMPDGKVGHAEIRIGDSSLMLADVCAGSASQSPDALGGSPVMLHLYVADVDAQFAQAVSAGAKVINPVTDQFYGDRSGGLSDPFGHLWYLATHKEDLSPEEIRQRAESAFSPAHA